MSVFNFSAGPAVLPQSVLQQAAAEMLDWHGSGMSVMEMSHRGKEFGHIITQAEADLCSLMNVPANYRILFMQGGALAMNALIPLNLLGKNCKADFVVTGSWSAKSLKEAQRYGDIAVAADGTSTDANAAKYSAIPAVSDWNVRSDAAYLHLCGNETIDGLEFFDWPDMGALGAPDVSLVADVSSHILSRPMDVSKFGLLFGGAQKNIGPAGLTISIVRDDLLDQAQAACPTALQYRAVADNESMYNTPPTYAIYIAGLVFQWLKAQGGLEGMEAQNKAKADLLYSALDASAFYVTHVAKACRSRMNVPFFLADASLNDAFLREAREYGLIQIKGHKSVGGMRASIYNAMPLEGVQALVEFMKGFEKRYG